MIDKLDILKPYFDKYGNHKTMVGLYLRVLMNGGALEANEIPIKIIENRLKMFGIALTLIDGKAKVNIRENHS